MTNPPGHLWRGKWTALRGPRSGVNKRLTLSLNQPLYKQIQRSGNQRVLLLPKRARERRRTRMGSRPRCAPRCKRTRAILSYTSKRTHVRRDMSGAGAFAKTHPRAPLRARLGTTSHFKNAPARPAANAPAPAAKRSATDTGEKDRPAQSLEPLWGRASRLQRCSGSPAGPV